MTVYEVKPDFTFQSFHTSDPESDNLMEVEYSRELIKCDRMDMTWRPLRLYEEHARLPRGNFARSWGGGFLVDSRAMTAIQSILGDECEFLPMLPFNGETLYLMNLLTCIDCLDREKTEFAIDEASGRKLSRAMNYCFHPDKISSASVFKLPKRVGVFAATGTGAGQPEFKTLIERQKLTGLIFRELWSDSK